MLDDKGSGIRCRYGRLGEVNNGPFVLKGLLCSNDRPIIVLTGYNRIHIARNRSWLKHASAAVVFDAKFGSHGSCACAITWLVQDVPVGEQQVRSNAEPCATHTRAIDIYRKP